MTSPDLATFVTGYFVRHLAAERNVSAHTTAAYRDTLKLLLRFARDRTHRSVATLRFEDLTPALILQFLDHLETDRHNTIRTRNARLAAIHSLVRYVADCEPALAVAVPAGARHSPQEDHASRARLSHRSRARAPPGAGGSVDLGRRTGLSAAGAAVRHGRADSGVAESDRDRFSSRRPALRAASKARAVVNGCVRCSHKPLGSCRNSWRIRDAVPMTTPRSSPIVDAIDSHAMAHATC